MSTEEATVLLTVEELQKSVQKFGIYDYVVFAGMLIGCAVIGVYYALVGSKASSDAATEYLMGGRNMKVFPIGMSLIASFISGITLLGVPTETYIYGTEYMFVSLGIILTGLCAGLFFLPILHDMQLSSTYEYLERRFDKKLRLFGSVMFAIAQVCWLPIVIYVPALAFNQVTGVNIHIITPCVCLVCIFYTTVGGLKAVVWTDVIQTWIMIGSIVVVVIKGTMDLGGFQVVWDRCWNSGRLEFPSSSLDPTLRHSYTILLVGTVPHVMQAGVLNQNMVQRYLTLRNMAQVQCSSLDPNLRHSLIIFLIGAIPQILQGAFLNQNMVQRYLTLQDISQVQRPGFLDFETKYSMTSVTFGTSCFWLQKAVISQDMIQRYLSLPKMKLVQRALWIFIAGAIGFTLLCGYSGLLVYATYYDCDPLTTKLAKAKDQLLPYLVMRVLGDLPGMPGLFVSGVFSAALSSLSTGLNSMSAVVLEDFIKPYKKDKMSDRMTNYVMRGVVVFFGIVCVALVYVVEKLGSVLQLSMSLGAITSGPLFGIFCSGIFLPWVNAKGAFYAGFLGLATSSFIILGSQRAQAAGLLSFPTKPTSVEGCDYIFNATVSAVPVLALEDEYVFPLFKISYLWYTMFGGIVTLILALIISAMTGFNDLEQLEPATVSPYVRRFLPRRKSVLLKAEEEELIDMLKKNKNSMGNNLDME